VSDYTPTAYAVGLADAGFKLQLRLAGGYGGPDRIILTPKAGNDNPYFLNLLSLEFFPDGLNRREKQQGAGHIYLFDIPRRHMPSG